MGNTPVTDNSIGYPTVLGSPFTSPLTPTSSIQYAGVDQNYPIAERRLFGLDRVTAGIFESTPLPIDVVSTNQATASEHRQQCLAPNELLK